MMKKIIFYALILATFLINTTSVAQKLINNHPLPPLSIDSLDSEWFENMLRRATDNNKVFGLGSTSFTMSEGMQLNNKMAQLLILKANYKIIALPVENWTLHSLNDYLTDARKFSDSGLLVITKQTFNHTAFYTEEFYALVKWIKSYNSMHENAPVKLKGINFLQPAPLAYLLTRYVMPADSLSAVTILQNRRSYYNDSLSFNSVADWYQKNNYMIKSKLPAALINEFKTDMNVWNYIKEWGAIYADTSKINFYNTCLLSMLKEQIDEYGKVILYGDSRMIARITEQTKVATKGFGLILHENLGQAYYAIISDYSTTGIFYQVNSKVYKLDTVEHQQAKGNTAAVLRMQYGIEKGLFSYQDLQDHNIPIQFNIYDLYNPRLKMLSTQNTPAFDMLAVFKDERPVKFLKK